ncbi:hypothetical protein CI109_104577 [Kwoniella shandongensis]|uniref:Uncharacterized protein n=1 Tax=Kwoniella shandongensis TaxID=1734106 RepID=A0A5M6BYQ9_9TREE|nr:uncharacterized protein CI109_005533 [Kwoniella shandongensis]KAA5526099.1 hypothetical protein CI109_005533 [Kwoniella shandongensis]
MSRPSPSFIRSALASTALPRATQTRSFIASASSRAPAAAAAGVNTTSIDYRILDGVNGFLPKANFDRLQEWQGGLWERLQAEVRNNPALVETKQKWDKYGLDMTDLLSSTARDSSLGLTYNYAALLLNNSFFLEGLTADEPKQVPREFRDLQEKVEAFAEGIVGGGWLWIVRSGANQADLDVIPTFASGTLLVTQRSQRGREGSLPLFAQPPSTGSPEPTNPSSNTEESSTTSSPPLNKRSTSSFGGSGRSSKNGVHPSPVAVLNLFEHAYLGEKYGVWDRRQYAQDWFKSLDWQKVSSKNAKLA